MNPKTPLDSSTLPLPLSREKALELLEEGRRLNEEKKVARRKPPLPSYYNYGVRFDTVPFQRRESFIYPTQPLWQQNWTYGRRFNWWKTLTEQGPPSGWVTNPRDVAEDPILTWARRLSDPVNFKINVHPWRNARV